MRKNQKKIKKNMGKNIKKYEKIGKYRKNKKKKYERLLA